MCCDRYLDTPCGQRWTHIRTQVLSVVDTPVFEWFILVLIFASSITLCFEDIYLDENIVLKKVLYWTNLGFCALFSIEMMLKWLALGFWRYFTSFWTILDFIIVFVSYRRTLDEVTVRTDRNRKQREMLITVLIVSLSILEFEVCMNR